MSDPDWYVAEQLAEHFEDPETIGILRDGVSLLARADSPVTPERMTDVSNGAIGGDRCENAIFLLQNAGILDSEHEAGIDRERLNRVTRGAEMLCERPTLPDNELVATIPDDETSIEERHFGPLLLRLRELVEGADRKISLVTPFFSDKVADRLVNPLDAAARDGVEITVTTRYLTYGDRDYNRDFVRTLLAHDAIADRTRLYEYVSDVESLGGTVHAKTIVVDDDRCYLGTANLTHRGLRDNLELGVILRDESASVLGNMVHSLRRSELMHRVEYEDGRFRQR